MRFIEKLKYFVFFVAIGISFPIFAKAPISNCTGLRSTVEIFSCLDNERDVLDSSLNKTYQRYLKTLKQMEADSLANMPKGLLVESLKNAQRMWIAYRDKSCDFDAKLAYGGSAAETNRIACIVRMTRARLDELDEQFTYWENH